MDIIITVERGCVQSVENIPKGCRVVVRDFDSALDIDKLADPLPEGFKRVGDSLRDVYEELIFD